MLVVDGVELDAIHQVLHIVILNNGKPIRFEKGVDPLNHAVEVGNMRYDVVGMDDIRAAPLRPKPLGERYTEELADGRYAAATGDGGNIQSGLNAENGNTLLLVGPEKIAIVAGDFGNQAVMIEAKSGRKVAGDDAGIL
jgi:hypothetical protein